MRFIVWCPMAFTESSGGIIALHKLAHNLALLGEQSFITTGVKHPDYLGTAIREPEALAMAARNDTIVIYPEIVKGNPLNANHVMRWLLNTPGVVKYGGGDGVYGPDDLVYKYEAAFKAPDESKVKGMLRSGFHNLNLFTNRGGQREGVCYLVKKGSKKPQTFHPAGALCVDDAHSKGGSAYLAELFNRCSTFISYDDTTFTSVQAALCGCVSIVVPTDGLSARQWMGNFTYAKYGIAYGLQGVQHALSTVHLLRDLVMDQEREALEQTKAFAAEARRLMR